ncbi:hypothetical protein [Exiguobacterium sp.]|uniref:hypothetical protein n=1 Tax=Exiguobacterium sp. TaxID=44751 RepID=UPI00263B3150|nr:hypothetical protein [Exiguobacterium sp.]MCC5891516.1 hypothetical protein [Exiguobacterium sp.]
MKRTITFLEARQLNMKHRLAVRKLYDLTDDPIILSIPASHHLYTAFEGENPVAAITAERMDYEGKRSILLRHEAYRDRHVFQGLVDRLFNQLSRETIHETAVLLQVKQHQDQDKLQLFQSLGFTAYHESVNYVLPLMPYEKDGYDNWSLTLVEANNYSTWLGHRNLYAHVLSDILPMSKERLHRHIERGHVCYTLHHDGKPVGVLRARIGEQDVNVHEIHIFGGDDVMQDAISFLQRTFHKYLKPSRQLRLTVTSLQPELQFAIIKQGAASKQSTFYTMTTEIIPAVSYSI